MKPLLVCVLLLASLGTACQAPDSSVDVSVPDLGIGASFRGRRFFPDDNIWNRDVSAAAIDPDSDRLIASIGNGAVNLHPDFGTVWDGRNIGMSYMVVPGTQARVPMSFDYASESDPGPYPIPANAPIEGGGAGSGDRHVLIVDRDAWKLYELFDAQASGGGWHAGSGAVFDLASNVYRPEGWTSADAAGMPILPGLVRYDEVMEQKEIRHALRFTVRNTRRAHVPPARHHASNLTDAGLPPMGMRVRLKAGYDISRYSAPAQVVLTALKKYGMFVADNGYDWMISGAHDMRWNDQQLGDIKRVPGSAFEVVKMEGLVVGN